MLTAFGKYQVIDFIGEGGFGRVFKAYDPTLKRYVAIKTCTLREAEMRERFAREAEIAANLRHANIMIVHDFGEENGEPYLVQEYLEGEDLDHKLKRGDLLDTATLVEWLRQVADGLLYAHARGVVHRDVKPGNVRILPDGTIRIMDFGIAKLMQSERQLTQTGFSVGTTGYLAPEQLRGEEIDNRVDIFSFGVMTYELIARRKPFEGDTITTILYRIAHEEPPPILELAPACPRRLAALIDRCLRKNREERYHSFAHVISELEDVARELSRGVVGPIPPMAAGESRPGALAATAAHTDRAPKRRRMTPAAWAVMAVMLAVGMFGLFKLWRPGEPASPKPGGENRPIADSQATAGNNDAANRRDSTVAMKSRTDSASGSSSGQATRDAGSRTPGTGSRGSRTGAGTPAPVSANRPQLNPKRVVLLVRGAIVDVVSAAEARLTSELIEAGYDVVEAATAVAALSDRFVSGQAGAVAQVGQASAAATVLIADATASAQPITGGVFSGSAAVTVRAYASASGRLLGSERFEIGTMRNPGEVGPTAAAAASAAVGAAAYQASRFVLRQLTRNLPDG